MIVFYVLCFHFMHLSMLQARAAFDMENTVRVKVDPYTTATPPPPPPGGFSLLLVICFALFAVVLQARARVSTRPRQVRAKVVAKVSTRPGVGHSGKSQAGGRCVHCCVHVVYTPDYTSLPKAPAVGQ